MGCGQLEGEVSFCVVVEIAMLPNFSANSSSKDTRDGMKVARVATDDSVS